MKIQMLTLAVLLAMGCQATAAEESMTVWSSPASATGNILGKDAINVQDKQNVASALALVPGVSLQKSGARNELQVRVRGFDIRQVPVFFDGVPVYIPYDGNLDLGRFLTSDIASLEVSKGYTSLLQGPNQMGGAINITTPRPTKPLSGSVGYRQGWSRGKDNASDAHASLALSNALGYLQVSGSRLKQDFLGLPRSVKNPVISDRGRMVNSATDDKRGIVKLGFTPREDDEYTFTYIRQDGEKENPPYSGTGGQQPRYWQWPQYDKQSYYYQGTTHLGRFTLRSRLYRDAFKNTLKMYNSLAALQTQTGSYSHYSDYSNGAGLQLASDVRADDILSFAINWKEDVHREKGATNAPYDRYKDRTWSLAGEYQWAVAERLDVVSGISYDWRNSLQGYKYQKDGSITHYDGNSQHAFNWQSMAKYTFDNKETLALSLSDRSRFPTLKERYTTSKAAYNQIAMVNPGLKPERARSLDITWTGTLSPRWGYEASMYYNRISDAILSHNIDAGTVQNRNSGRVNYTGLDLGVKGNIARRVDMGVSYGLIHSDPQQREAGKITGSPAQTFNSWLKVTPVMALSLTLSEEARSSSYSNSDGSQKAPGFAVTHLRAEYEIARGLSLNASVNNLFDTEYYYSEGFVETGRNYWTGIDYRF